MSKDNKANLKADHGQHRELQKRKANDRAFIISMSAMICLFVLLFIPTCQQAKEQGVTYEQR